MVRNGGGVDGVDCKELAAELPTRSNIYSLHMLVFHTGPYSYRTGIALQPVYVTLN